MSDLLNTSEGRNVIIEAQRFLLRRGLARFFKRNLAIDFEQYEKGLGEFDLSTLLGQLNVAWDDELRDLYRLLGTVGGLTESIAETEINVNPATGSDITGTGSADRPYASLWFIGDDPGLTGSFTPNMLPRVINHPYRILIRGDVVFPGTMTLTHQFGDNGCLSFIGIGPEEEVLAGLEGSLTAVTNIQFCALELDLSVTPTVNCRPVYIQFTSGANDRAVAGVNRIDAVNNRLWIRRNPASSVAPADTYRYVIPAQTLKCNGLTVDCRGSRYVGKTINYRGARVVFCNLDIEIEENSFGVDRTCEICDGVPVSFGFCRILIDFGNFYPWKFSGEINRYRPIDDQVENLSGTNISNLFHGSGGSPQSCGCKFIPQNGDTEYPADQLVLEIGNGAWVESVECGASAGSFSCGNIIYRSYFKELLLSNTNTAIWQCIIDPDNVNEIALSCYESHIQHNLALYGQCLDAIRLRGTKFTFNDGGGDAAATITNIVGYAVRVEGLSGIYFAIPWSGTSGTTNDMYFPDLAVPLAAAFPAANSLVTDALGNNASRGA